MRKIKTAVIGSGFMGKVHTEGIRRLGYVEVAAVAASSGRDPAKIAAAYDVPRATADWNSLVGDNEIEAVHICTPNALHYPMAKAFIEAGKHVLCEKPLAMSAAEAEEMVDLANQATCCPLHQSQPALLPGGAAHPPHDRERRSRRDPGGAGHLLAGLAALRHRLQLAHRSRRTTDRCASWATSARTGWT